MTTITGTLCDGKVEFHGPTPAAWIDDMEVNESAEESIRKATVRSLTPHGAESWMKSNCLDMGRVYLTNLNWCFRRQNG